MEVATMVEAYQDRLLRNSLVKAFLDLTTILVSLYSWLSIASSRMTPLIGVSFALLFLIYFVIGCGVRDLGVIWIPAILFLISLAILHRSARKD